MVLRCHDKDITTTNKKAVFQKIEFPSQSLCFLRGLNIQQYNNIVKLRITVDTMRH